MQFREMKAAYAGFPANCAAEGNERHGVYPYFAPIWLSGCCSAL